MYAQQDRRTPDNLDAGRICSVPASKLTQSPRMVFPSRALSCLDERRYQARSGIQPGVGNGTSHSYIIFRRNLLKRDRLYPSRFASRVHSVRQRATRPVFTVEVKRRRSKSPHPFTTPEGHPREGLRREGLVAAFSPESSAQSSVDWGDLIKSNLFQERAPSSTATPTAEPTAKIRTGRILPDVLGDQLAAEGIEPQAGERAREDRATRRRANLDARPRQPRAETRQAAKHISSTGSTRAVETSCPPSAEVREPPQSTVRPAERGVIAPDMMPTGDRIQGVVHPRQRTKDNRVRGAQRRAKRHGFPVPLRRGERWKRHLPKVCW
jgi:hypothetical protein